MRFPRANGFSNYWLWDCFAVLPIHWLSACPAKTLFCLFWTNKGACIMCVCLDLMGKCTLLLNLESGEWRMGFLDLGALGLISCFDVPCGQLCAIMAKLLPSSVCHPRQPTILIVFVLSVEAWQLQGKHQSHKPTEPTTPIAIRLCFSFWRCTARFVGTINRDCERCT